MVGHLAAGDKAADSSSVKIGFGSRSRAAESFSIFKGIALDSIDLLSAEQLGGHAAIFGSCLRSSCCAVGVRDGPWDAANGSVAVRAAGGP